MMKKVLVLFLSIITLSSLSQSNDPASQSDLTKYVNSFIGTKNMGHTYPGATSPFGMVQLSPNTSQTPMFIDGKYNKDVYRYCSGYQYEDSTIYGFAHTHFSGTGHSDLGDFLLMPITGELNLNPGNHKNNTQGFYSTFDHKNESASPGLYKVHLDDYDIDVSLTATERVGFHNYNFNNDDSIHIILDMVSNIYNYDGKNVWTFIRVESDTLVTGYRQTTGWARTRTMYFAMVFSEPVSSYGYEKYDETPYNGFYRKFNEYDNFPEMAGRDLRAFFNFENTHNLKIKFALSGVSTNGALLNLQHEIPHWDFQQTVNETNSKWNSELSKIKIETYHPEQLTTFYTALYHTMLSPVIFEDVDGSYRGLDQNIYTSKDFDNYTIFSLWDTYRALHPLFNLIQPERNNNMIKSMMAHHDQSVHNMLPIWSHYANENWCMVGYHSVSVIADALVKNTTDVDIEKALQACVNTSNVPYYDGLDSYISMGYVAEDKSGSSVSKTLEYAYDDWCISQIADKTGDTNISNEYVKRSEYYKNVYDSRIGFMRPKLSNGQWKKEFNPMDTHGQGYIEGNAWNYGLYVPHNVDMMIEMMGGKDRFSEYLDSIFTVDIPNEYISKNEDITRDGIIGNYVHGNEPGHHIPYLYNYTNDAWKTQERVRVIMDTMYGANVDGLCGNDDAGQMSAWYIFSALGFYPVAPGSDYYDIGSPLVRKAIIQLGNDKTLTINTTNQSATNVYVENILVNGKYLKGNKLHQNDILNGGEITFNMSSKPKIR